ncbi:Dihydrodipicolinate synthase [Rhodovastum atsumiense]|uniref:Dihydrodipicolinate synthase family protein n=1 Tax=Rhodovastum atsumiense TaxID=504468 RepID=A0A5M6IXM5_9PROT|nr:dihydrodipicolinate synthase family protein [Rhodovastum atsumiense]KAA5612148.1 dihydrodipicolinate synthase family protein [Rhodovastum atsumiense]CAH2603907.1 Dihydrodipicolinate synthase [Rhodovastum atsumiense]
MTRPNDKYHGVWPVMLTPFDDDGEIDYGSLAKLIDWYIAAGVHGLFAACQSSEIFFLSDAETQRLVRFVVDHVAGRVPVVASGHTAAAASQQIDQINAIAACGVDGVILISNRLAMPAEGDDRVLRSLERITAATDASLDLGIYECPYPSKRLLSDEVIRWCAASNRFTFIKDTCCSLPRIRQRLALVQGSRLRIANANSQTLLGSLQAGAHGYSGVMANFHPDLYVWLYEHWRDSPETAERLQNYLSVAALAETLSYPVSAKDYHTSIGTFASTRCRAREANGYFTTHEASTMRQMLALGEDVKQALHLP